MLMRNTFKYGPLAIAIYQALLWLTILVGLFATDYIVHYVGFLLFLGLGLKPLLVHTGLYRLVEGFLGERQAAEDERLYKQRSFEIDRKERSKRLKMRREKDKSLPKHW